MEKPNIQIDDVVREMNDEEFGIYVEEKQLLETKKAEEKAKAQSKASALAKLAELGLTEEEIAAL